MHAAWPGARGSVGSMPVVNKAVQFPPAGDGQGAGGPAEAAGRGQPQLPRAGHKVFHPALCTGFTHVVFLQGRRSGREGKGLG